MFPGNARVLPVRQGGSGRIKFWKPLFCSKMAGGEATKKILYSKRGTLSQKG